MALRRMLAWLALLLGCLGVVASIAAVYAVWSLHQCLYRTSDQAFSVVDTTLTEVRDRVLRAQQRVTESEPTTEELGQRLRDWSKQKATQTAALRQEVAAKAEKLSGWMQQADQWLENSETTLRGTRQIMGLARSLSAPADPALVDEGLEKLATARRLMQQATEAVDGIRTFTAQAEEKEPLAERLARTLPLAARLLATMTDLDTRLGELAKRLSAMQTQTAELHDRTCTLINRLTLACSLLVVWVAAGQAALIYWGWKNCRRFPK